MNNSPTKPYVLKPIVRIAYAKRATIQDRFFAFHNANPHVYDQLRALAYRVKKKHPQLQKIGMQLLVEHLRWLYLDHTVSTDGFRISNDFVRPYAQLIEARNPALKDFFTTRKIV